LKYDKREKAYVGHMMLPPNEELGFVKLSIIAIDNTGKETEFVRSVEILPPSGVTLIGLRIRDDQIQLYMRVGRKEKIDLYGQFSDGIERYLSGSSSTVTYTSSDANVATVTNDGLIIARDVGQATINVRTGGKKISIAVAVKPKK
jgi:hypothetical protein